MASQPPNSSPRHVVILPYYCDSEVRRFTSIADWLVRESAARPDCTFVLASSPRTPPSEALFRAWSRIGPVEHFRCPTPVFGYPQGPTAMFWDAMDHVAANFRGDGFALWLESDMVVVRPDWLELLTADWDRGPRRPLLMGCYVPRVYKFRWLRRRKPLLEPHINGGACYALDFARRMPPAAREGTFDMAVFQHARALDGIAVTSRIGFSTVARVRRDVVAGNRCILHGFMQDKDRFVDRALRPVSGLETRTRFLLPHVERIEEAWQRLRLCFFRRGPAVMLQNLMLEQKRIPADRLPLDTGP